MIATTLGLVIVTIFTRLHLMRMRKQFDHYKLLAQEREDIMAKHLGDTMTRVHRIENKLEIP